MLSQQSLTVIENESDNIDEGFLDTSETAPGLNAGPEVAQLKKIAIVDDDDDLDMTSTLVPPGELRHSHKDSGFSSRMSEADEDAARVANPLLLDQKLARRLTRISECQNDEECRCSVGGVLRVLLKILLAFVLLYTFICLLDLLGNAFRLLGGKTAGGVFQDSELLRNPITGLMIGVLATVILQSSSTSSSIVITMVASKIIDLRPAIPIIMGANIGTTVTNTLVSLAHSMQRREFRRAFSGAVIHDVFNWLTVLILLPVEHYTGYLYHLTGVVIRSLNMENMKADKQDLLKKLTKPLTSRIVMVDKKVITGIAQGHEEFRNKSLLKVYCSYDEEVSFQLVNESRIDNTTGLEEWTAVNRSVLTKVPAEKCESLFSVLGWDDTTSGLVLLASSIVCLSLCLYLLVKLLHSLLGGHIARALRKTINSDFPGPFGWLTGYVALIVGAGMTILVQSSSVFTSALTPLVGIGCLKLERMYPLTLGSNIGTTFTGILAALASSASTMHIALQLAFCHLFFNISGILLFYPVPKMRLIVINTAKYLGRTTARYRWFAVAYLIVMFILFPGFFFALSLAGPTVFVVVLSSVAVVAVVTVVLTLLQRSTSLSTHLPAVLKSWKFLPKFMRSLEPFDSFLQRAMVPFSKCCLCCRCCKERCKCLGPVTDEDMGDIDTDSDSEGEDSMMQVSYLSSAVSSKAHLSLSQSPSQPSFTESRRIYRPNGPMIGSEGSIPSSHRDSVARRSPSMRRVTYADNQSQMPLLVSPCENRPNFFISQSDAEAIGGSDFVIDVSGVDVGSLTESKI